MTKKTNTKRIGSLQIEPEAASQNTLFWTIQKIIMSILFLFLMATIFGLTGPGLLEKKQANNESFSVKYDFFARKNANQTIEIDIRDNLLNSTEKTFDIGFSEEYMKDQYIKQITPSPIRMFLRDGMIVFTFMQNKGFNHLYFLLEPQRFGFLKTTIQIGDGNVINIHQLIYP